MNKSLRNKFFIMMVLEFFIWGAWLPLIFNYLPSLGFSSSVPPAAISSLIPHSIWFLFSQQALILNAFPVAAIIGMFFSNQFADRNFAAEKFLAFSHFIGGLALLGIATIKAPAAVPGLAPGDPNPNAPFAMFFGLMLIHCLLYVPTMSITNSIAFTHMQDAQKEFGFVRMGGTLGWILAAWPFAFILVDWDAVRAAHPSGISDWIGKALANGLTGERLQAATKWTYVVAGIASLLLAGWSLLLPHTPPKKAGQGGVEKLAWVEALKLLKHPYVLILWLVTFADACVHNSYFNWAGSFLGTSVDKGGPGIHGNWIMPVMSIGQIAELLTMFILGATLKRLGYRLTMILGILAYPVRFAVWAFFPHNQTLIILVQILHGICYAFFFVSVYIFAEDYFPKDVRGQCAGAFQRDDSWYWHAGSQFRLPASGPKNLL